MMIVLSFVAVVGACCSVALGSPLYTSSVYLQRGPDRSVPAVEYVEYGAPAVSVSGAQYARLAASPVVPYTSGYRPCVSPCVVEPVGVASIPTSRAKIVAYQNPTPKVTIVPRSEEPGAYEYSYIVYDEDTGDQKAQHELSEGGKVRGQYSFIQPDGFIREVQYTADDLSGFNAIVKNFLPKPEDAKAELKVAQVESHEEVEHHSEEQKSAEEIHVSAEVSSDAPEVTEDNKIIVTFEDIIRCAQAAIVAGGEKKAETPASHEHSEGDGHAHGHSEESHASHEELASHEEHAHEEHSHEEHAPESASQSAEKAAPKAAKSALTYIILPSLGLKKPC